MWKWKNKLKKKFKNDLTKSKTKCRLKQLECKQKHCTLIILEMK